MRRFWWLMVPLALGACDGSSGGGGDDDDDDDDDAPAQGQPIERACRNAADCAAEAGGELDIDQCVIDSEQARDDAQAAGCGQEWGTLAQCSATADCDREYGFLTGCDSEVEAYITCVVGG